MTGGLGRFLRHNTVALLALFVALGGTSFAAATLINGSQIKPHTIAKNRLTNKAIKQLKGNRGPRGLQGVQGARGATGAQGVPGSALGYAYIKADGTLDTTRSKNVNSVQKGTTGFYCLDTSVPVVNAVASANHNTSQFDDVAETIIRPETDAFICDDTHHDIAIAVGRGSTNALVDDDVMVVFN
jgi:hypothetical protein